MHTRKEYSHSHSVLFEYSCKLTAERTSSVVRLVNLHVPWARGPQRGRPKANRAGWLG